MNRLDRTYGRYVTTGRDSGPDLQGRRAPVHRMVGPRRAASVAVMRVLYFDYPSLPAVVAVVRAEAALRRYAGSGNRPPMLAFAGFDTLGLEVAVPVTLDQLEEFDRWRDGAAAVGLDVVRPQLRPATTLAHVVGDLADERRQGHRWRTRVITAYWTQGADIGDPTVLRRLASDINLPGGEVAASLGDVRRAQRVRRRMVAARQRSIGGVPVIDVDGTLVAGDLSDESWDALLASW